MKTRGNKEYIECKWKSGKNKEGQVLPVSNLSPIWCSESISMIVTSSRHIYQQGLVINRSSLSGLRSWGFQVGATLKGLCMLPSLVNNDSDVPRLVSRCGDFYVLLYLARDFAKSGFHFHFTQQFQTALSLSILDRFAWNWNCVPPCM